MLNQEPEFFYSRNLKIGNSIDNTIVSTIEYQQEDESHYTARVRFTSNTQEAFGNTTIRYRTIENGKIKDKGKRKTDESGLISISLPDLKPIAARQIEVELTILNIFIRERSICLRLQKTLTLSSSRKAELS